MNTANDLLNGLLQNPACLILWLALNLLGVLLQKTRLIPDAWNRFIPLALLGLGIVLAPLLVPVTIFPPTQPNPKLLLAVLGFIFGVLAWFVHAVPLQWLLKKFPVAGGSSAPGNNNNQNQN